MASATTPAFHEVQRFRQVWLWLLMAIMFVVVVRAYNVSGNRGVLLTFKTGKTLLIGSRRARGLRGLAAAIKAIR